MTLDQVKSFVSENGIEFFLCSFVEMSGTPKAKVIPVTHLEDMANDGAGFGGFAAGEIGQGPHDPEMACIPDFSSLTIVPWRENLAWVAGDMFVEGQSWHYCPRTILRNQLEKAKQNGYVFNVGIEAEFMLLKQDEDGQYIPWDTLDSLDKPCYERRGIHSLPSTLSDAIDALEADEVIRNALGTEYADYYIQAKREEWQDYHLSVSQWETDKYIEVY